AAFLPTSGLAPAPKPLVSFTPSWILIGACDICSACRSVFATRNSTPSTLALIMRFTALPPPPPTPITLIFALLRGSSLKLMRISSVLPSPLPFAIRYSPFEIQFLWRTRSSRQRVKDELANSQSYFTRSPMADHPVASRSYKQCSQPCLQTLLLFLDSAYACAMRVHQ